MLTTIQVLRVLVGLIAVWQIVGLLPVLTNWLPNLQNVTGGMWAIVFIKLLVMIIFGGAYLWLGKIKRRFTNHEKTTSEARVIIIVVAALLAIGIVLAITIPALSNREQKSESTITTNSPSAPAQHQASQAIDPRDSLLQLHVEQLSDDQYNSAVNRWLELHPEASSPESRDVMSQLLQEIYAQYPRSALGPALDMALQRGQRNASSNTEQTPAQGIPANCTDYTSVAIPPHYSGARVTFNFNNVPIRSFLKLIEQEANRRIIPGDDVNSGITVCAQNIPWDYALDKILADNGYGQTEYNGSIRVFRR